MRILKSFAAAAIAVSLLGFSPAANADDWNKKTHLTVNEAIEIPGAVLQPGEYVIRLVESDATRHVVRFMNKEEDEVISTVIAIPNQRMQVTGDTQFGWYETPANEPAAMRAWFYPGDSFGQEFVYPETRGSQLAAATGRNVPTMSDSDADGLEIEKVGETTIIAVTPQREQTDIDSASAQNQQMDRDQPMQREGNVDAREETMLAQNQQEQQQRQMEQERQRQAQAEQQRQREQEQERLAQEREREQEQQQLAQQREQQRRELEEQRRRTAEAQQRLQQQEQQQMAQNNQQEPDERLPETAGSLPLIALLAGLSFGSAATVRKIRRR